MRARCLRLLLALAVVVPAAAAEAQGGRKAARVRKAPAGKKAPRFAPVTLFHVNHRESMVYRPYDPKGRLRQPELKRFNRFMRDGKGRVGRMHPRLATLFYRVAQHYAGKRVEVISGYRPDARNPRSPHRKGLAVDFRVQGVRNADLRDYLRRGFDKVGVGYYPNSVFVHFDVRQRSAFWIDYSGPGEEAVYSDNPDGDLRSGRADTWKPPKQPPASAPDGDSTAGDDGPPPGQEAAEPPRRAEPAPADDETAAVAPSKDAAARGVKPGDAAKKPAPAPGAKDAAPKPAPPAAAPAALPGKAPASRPAAPGGAARAAAAAPAR
ncbi:MAG TPA: DUF882 domain-containing protein [Polyangia bacterium]|jgi:uncharacterized protein YcbK (DUF882 family)